MSQNKRLIRLWSDGHMVEYFLDLSKIVTSFEIKKDFANLFNRTALEILSIKTGNGQDLTEFDELYEPATENERFNLNIIFKPKMKSRKRKLELEESSSDSEKDYKNKFEVFKCERCGEMFNEKNEDSKCYTHNGNYLENLDEKFLEKPNNDVKQLDPDIEPSSLYVEKTRKYWTCCKSSEQYSKGCVATNQKHKRISPNYNQKLYNFFTSHEPINPPKESPQDNQEEQVRIIGRQELLGNANPNARVNLLPNINQNQSFCLNESKLHNLHSILGNNFNAFQYLESDCDQELLITIKFNTQCKIQLIQINPTNIEQAPSKISIYKNNNLNFENILQFKPDQEFTIDENQYKNSQNNIVNLSLPAFKFSKTNFISIYVSSNIGQNPKTEIAEIKFFGIASRIL